MHSDRKNARKALGYSAWIVIPGAPIQPCHIEDASDGGAKLIVADEENIPQLFKLMLSPTAQTYRECEVRWRRIGQIGIRYLGNRSKDRCELVR